MGSGASRAPSPALRKYFETLMQMNLQHNKEFDAATMADIATDEAKRKKFEEKEAKFRRTMRRKLVPLIEKSFDEHNEDKSKATMTMRTLNQAESSLWFSHYVYEKTRFEEAMIEQAHQDAKNVAMTTVAKLGDKAKAEQKREEIQRKIEANMEMFKAKVQQLQADYQANKAERDAAAFKVLDTSGDGRLNKPELVIGLLPGEEKFKLLQAALGIEPERLAMEQASTADCEVQ